MTVRLAGALIKRVVAGVGGSTVGVRRIMVGIGGSAVQVWSSFASSGMDLVANQTMTATNTWQRLLGWAARSGYASTVIEDDGIRVPAGTIVNWTLSLSVPAQPGPSNSQSARLVNGATVVDTVVNSGYSSSASKTGQMTGTGEIVRVEASVSSTASGRGTIGAGTYLMLDLPA